MVKGWLTPSTLKAYIGFWPILGFAEFDYFIFGELSDNFFKIYVSKHSFFMILQVT